MRYALIDDSGAVRGVYAQPHEGQLFDIEGEASRELEPLANDDPLLAPPPPPAAKRVIAVDDVLAATDFADLKRRLESQQ